MPLALEQSFPLGRFHATRWNQNPFEDRHGEWPPSPWRLLRALAARWFQYTRETGDKDETARDELLQKLAAKPPAFHLPAFTWRGDPAPRQYHKTEVAWTDAKAKAAAYKKPKTTLTVDVFRAIPPNEHVIWVWDTVELSPHLTKLLGELLKRIRYFGRAETHCRFRIVKAPAHDSPRHELTSSTGTGSPVLVATPDAKLNVETVLACTDDRLFKGRQIPPGTEWRYVRLPQCPRVNALSSQKLKSCDNLQLIQFALGGRVYPAEGHWVRVVEKFRGRVLKHAARILSRDECASYGELSHELRDKLKLLSGKDGRGRPTQDHQHAYFFLYPDDNGNPSRLVAYRQMPFDAHVDNAFEVEAVLSASRKPLFWQGSDPDWSLCLVPLPGETPPPTGCCPDAVSAVWISATPFVPPDRHRFRKNGRLRVGEDAVALLRTAFSEALVRKGTMASIVRIDPVDSTNNPIEVRQNEDPPECSWPIIHESLRQRRQRSENRTRRVRPGFRFRIELSHPVCGPILVGHSSHYGLGLFVPENPAHL